MLWFSEGWLYDNKGKNQQYEVPHKSGGWPSAPGLSQDAFGKCHLPRIVFILSFVETFDRSVEPNGGESPMDAPVLQNFLPMELL